MVKKLRLDDLLEKNEPIYVLNQSGKQTGTKGVIHITFVDPSSGKTIPFTVDRTWLPVNLSERIPKPILQNSIDLRGMIAKGFLDLVPAIEAEKLLRTAEARIEQERLMNNERASRSFSSTVAPDDDSTKVLSPENTARISQGLEPVSAEDRVNPKVRDILLRVESGSLSSKMGVAELRSVASDLRDEDASYIIAFSKAKEIKNYGQQLLKEINDKVENPFDGGGQPETAVTSTAAILKPSAEELDESMKITDED